MEVTTITSVFQDIIIREMKEEFGLDISDGPDSIIKIERVNDSDKPGIIERIWFEFKGKCYFGQFWHNDGYKNLKKVNKNEN